MKKLRVLVIDDSAYNRRIITDLLETDPDIEVVGGAYDGEAGLKLAAQLKPDLITLDIEMPRMDRFTFLRLLMAQMPTPVIVISSHSRKHEVFQALELGALDFIAKPTHFIGPDAEGLRRDLQAKAQTVRALQVVAFTNRHEAKPLAHVDQATVSTPTAAELSQTAQRIVVIGASTGGPPALERVFRALKPDGKTAYLISQHMPERFTKAFAERLDRVSQLKLVEAEDGSQILAGTAFIARGGHHMVVGKKDGNNIIQLIEPEVDDRYVPCVNRLFKSAAEMYGPKVMATVLTGMGSDGADGVKHIREAQGKIIAESEETAIVFGMPKEAQETGMVDEVLRLEDVAERLQRFADTGK